MNTRNISQVVYFMGQKVEYTRTRSWASIRSISKYNFFHEDSNNFFELKELILTQYRKILLLICQNDEINI